MEKINTHYTVGQQYRDFIVDRITEIPELQSVVLELTHQPSGAQVMHIAHDDDENLFCLSFRTEPSSSNGVAHVLEHTVLCGSEKFPVRDPFFSMNRRSLNTFMNAMTGADFTCYPAASQVPQDFYNILEVYLDSVFHPKIEELSFLQEGHRLEFDEKDVLTRKGIVFNEMKGAMASPTARLSEVLMEALFPDITYGNNSGGDPAIIPELTYAKLLNFHKMYYHPSRCLFFFYGNMPLEKHLDFIEENALHGVSKLPALPPIPLQRRFSDHVHIEQSYPITAEEYAPDKSLISMGWLTTTILEQLELLALYVLEIVLMGTDAAPLKMALLKSGLCKQASAHIDGEMSEVPILLTMKGCLAENADKLEVLIRESLQNVIKKGIPQKTIDAAIHQLELYRSEITGDHSPYGLSLFMRSALLKQHGGLPEDGLSIQKLFKKLRKLTNDPDYLTSLISKYLLDNTHFVRVVMTPDTELSAKELKKEHDNLQAIESKLTDDQRRDIHDKSERLHKLQENDEGINLEILPKVTLRDVPKYSRDFPLSRERIGNLDVLHHNCFTNDFVYADIVFNLPDIPEKDLSFAQLFTLILPHVGCGSRNYKTNLEYIQEHTGGIGASLSLNNDVQDPENFTPSFCLGGKALRSKSSKLFPLMRDMLESADFTDIPRIKELISQHHSGLENNINSNAMGYAISTSCSGLSVGTHISSLWHGLPYLLAVRQLAKSFDKNAKDFIDKLQALQAKLLSLKDTHLVMCCDKPTYENIKNEGFFTLSDLHAKSHTPWKGDYKAQESTSGGYIISSPVAFTSQAFNTVPYTHKDTPILSLATFILNNKTLHKRIREQGGAYGGGAVNAATSGKFYFYAYRDPAIANTVNTFKEAANDAAAGDFDARDLEEAKLETIQQLDNPISPGSRGITAFSWLQENKTLEMHQKFRDAILTATKEDIQSAVKKHIIPALETAPIATFAGKDLLEKDRALNLEIHTI